MKYSEYRKNIKSGDLLAWSHRSWASWYDFKVQMIRVFTQSEYTHVGIAWKYGSRVFVIEAVAPLIRIVPLSNLLPCYTISTNATWNKSTEDSAMSLIGKGIYSQWEAIKAYFRKNKHPNLWECGELTNYLLYLEGIDLDTKDVPSDIILAAQKRFTNLVYLEE